MYFKMYIICVLVGRSRCKISLYFLCAYKLIATGIKIVRVPTQEIADIFRECDLKQAAYQLYYKKKILAKCFKKIYSRIDRNKIE